MKKETPENISDLVKAAGDKKSWKRRLEALKILGNYDCQQSKDVITRLALHDRVFQVKEEAVRTSQKMNLTYKGKPIRLTKKDIGYSNKDFEKQFARIKREKKMDEFDLVTFKDAFLNQNPEMYDVMKFEKGKQFDEWIENKFKSLPNKTK